MTRARTVAKRRRTQGRAREESTRGGRSGVSEHGVRAGQRHEQLTAPLSLPAFSPPISRSAGGGGGGAGPLSASLQTLTPAGLALVSLLSASGLGSALGLHNRWAGG